MALTHIQSLEPARKADLDGILSLLAASGLPDAQLADHFSACLVVRQHDGTIAGCVALELYGDSALLRSLAVREELRGVGLGKALAYAALQSAKERKIGDVYLLTETAPEFFKRLGFVHVERADVPEHVRQSVEFTTACPETAQAMHLHLD